jgi:flavodoxin
MKTCNAVFAVLGVVLLCGIVFADSGNPVFQAKRILVVYYSRTGNTEQVAKDIAGRLKADMEKITDRHNRSGFFGVISAARAASNEKMTDIGIPQKDPSLYDLVIVGTPTWAGRMTPAVRTYIGMNKGKFKAIAFFTTSHNTKAEKVVAKLEEIATQKAVASTGFDKNELKDTKVYNDKIDAFVKALQ